MKQLHDAAVIGENVVRVDGQAKVTGQAQYISDLVLPGMLHGAILRSPLAHARIKKIDTTRAKRLPGVKTVITAEDTPKIKYGLYMKDELVLAAEKVRFIGDEVAAVAAVDEATAAKALSLIDVEYETLPGVFNFNEAMQKDAPAVHDEKPDNITYSSIVSRGDVDEAFRQADLIVEGTYETPAVNHCYLEPFVTVAQMEGSKLALWVPCQNPFTIRNMVAGALSLSPSDIRLIHQLDIGGAFGGKLDSKLPPICALLAIKSGRPVKLVSTRDDEFNYSCRVRVGTRVYMKTAVSSKGKLLGREVRIWGDNGAYSSLAPKIVCTNMAIRSDNLYRLPAVRTEAFLVYTNKMPSGAFRGYGNPQMHFALESQMDEIAAKLNLDPLELRLKNAVQTGDVTLHGWKMSSCGLSECLEKVRESSCWIQKKKEGPKNRGLGVAAMIHVSGNRGNADYHGSEAIIKIQEDGRVQLITGEVEIGQGSRTVLAQIAAAELGVPFDQIEVLKVDTDLSPYVFGAFSSRTTHIAGNAVLDAARKARLIILNAAGELMNEKPENLEIIKGMIRTKGSAEDAGITLREVVKSKMFHKNGSSIICHGIWDPDTVLLGEDKYGDISTGYPFAAHAAEVEVDTETGKVKLINYYAAHDVGKAINPMLAEGQIDGGVSQGLGYALTEQILTNEGRVLNGNLLDYKIPTAMDVPNIQSILVEPVEPLGPFGAKGLGEPTLIPVAPAIANAIFDAVGVRIKDLPITPEKILSALKKKDL